MHTYYVCSLAARLQGLNGVVRVDVVHRFSIDHDNLVFGAAKQVNTGRQVFMQQSNNKGVSIFVNSKKHLTYNSRPMAGPFGSTSDTMIDVSPSGCGLSLPPDIAKPNPSLESCHFERIGKKWDGEKMTVSKECREAGGWMSMSGRYSREIGGGKNTFQCRQQWGRTAKSWLVPWGAAGCVTLNSWRSLCCETKRPWTQSGLKSFRNYTETHFPHVYLFSHTLQSPF